MQHRTSGLQQSRRTVRLVGIRIAQSRRTNLKIKSKSLNDDNEKKETMTVCKRKCKLDKVTDTCTGCGRTMQQIREAFTNAK